MCSTIRGEGLKLRVSNATHSDASALSLEDLRFSYGPMPVLFGVSFAVAAGEAVALVGTNGAGKSTILRLVAGLERPDAGRVVFDGHDVTGVGAEELARRGVVLVRGGIGVFADLTVAENLDLQAAVIAQLQSGGGSRTVEDICSAMGHPEQCETVFLLLERLSRNPGRGVIMEMPDALPGRRRWRTA